MFGDFPFQSRPWKPEEVAGVEFTTVGELELNIELIAALRPDLIPALYAGLTPLSKEHELHIDQDVAIVVLTPGERRKGA